MTLGRWAYLDDRFVEADAAQISPFDRAALFAHAAYEVTAVYNGLLIDTHQHLRRLSKTLKALDIAPPEPDLLLLQNELIARNDLMEGLVYLQVSAGNHGPRDFHGPETLTPSLFLFTTDKKLIDEPARSGVKAISVEDTRWKCRDLKTTQLVSQSLAYRAARRSGAYTAIMHEDGLVTEAASANVWIVTEDGTIITRDTSPALLPGITRHSTLKCLESTDRKIEERAFTLEEARAANEMFTTSTGVMILPITHLDGQPVGDGTPGRTTRMVQRLYYDYIGADTAHVAPWTTPH